MIENVTISGVIPARTFVQTNTVQKTATQSTDSGDTNSTSAKKKFKSDKELLAYLMFLDARMKNIEEKAKAHGGVGALMEHRAEYNKLKNEMKELTSSVIV